MAAYLLRTHRQSPRPRRPERRIVQCRKGMRVDADTGRNHHRHHRRRHINIERVGNRSPAFGEHVGIPNSPEWALDSKSSKPTTPCSPTAAPPDRPCVGRRPRPVRSRRRHDDDPSPHHETQDMEEESSGTPTPTAQPQTRTNGSNRGRRLQTSQRRLPPSRKGRATPPHEKTSGRLPCIAEQARTAPHRSPWTRQAHVGRLRHFPDGTPYPPILLHLHVRPRRPSRTAGITTFRYANDTGMPTNRRHATLDRIYTGPDAEVEQPVRALDWTITKSLTANQKVGSIRGTNPSRLRRRLFYTDALPTGLRDLPARPQYHPPRSSLLGAASVAPTRPSNTATRQPEASDLGGPATPPASSRTSTDKSPR